jgi:hypothetical protein
MESGKINKIILFTFSKTILRSQHIGSLNSGSAIIINACPIGFR